MKAAYKLFILIIGILLCLFSMIDLVEAIKEEDHITKYAMGFIFSFSLAGVIMGASDKTEH